MAASTTDLFTYVGNPGTATTLSAPGYTSGGTSINVGSTTNFPTSTAVVFAIDEVETVGGEEVRTVGTYNTYRGIVASGTSITNVTWLNGDGDRDYAAGSSTRVYITTASAWANRLVDGLSVEHNKDGTHSTITGTSINLTGAVTSNTISEKTAANGVTVDGLNIKDGKLNTNDSVVTTNITDASVTNAKLATGAGEPGGAWNSWTPTLSGRLNDTKWTKSCKYKQVGKTVYYILQLTANAATPMDGGTAEAIFTLPVTSVSMAGTSTTQNIGNTRLLDTGTASYLGRVEWVTTTTAQIRVDNAAGTYLSPAAITSTVPHTWANTDEIWAAGFYEAA